VFWPTLGQGPPNERSAESDQKLTIFDQSLANRDS